MQKLAPNVPNLVKQPAQCCVHCGKSYAKKTNLAKHVVLCEMLHQSKKKKMGLSEEPDQEAIPSAKKLYSILLEFGQRFQNLEEKVDELSKWVVKKKKRINMIEWLNTHCVPTFVDSFDRLSEKIEIKEGDILFLFDHSFLELWSVLMQRFLPGGGDQSTVYPVATFAQKPYTVYVYENEEVKWIEASRETLAKFFNRVHIKLMKRFSEWKKVHRAEINDNESLSLTCDHTTVKLMAVDFREENIFGKVRAALHAQIKKNIHGLVDLELEF